MLLSGSDIQLIINILQVLVPIATIIGVILSLRKSQYPTLKSRTVVLSEIYRVKKKLNPPPTNKESIGSVLFMISPLAFMIYGLASRSLEPLLYAIIAVLFQLVALFLVRGLNSENVEKIPLLRKVKLSNRIALGIFRSYPAYVIFLSMGFLFNSLQYYGVYAPYTFN